MFHLVTLGMAVTLMFEGDIAKPRALEAFEQSRKAIISGRIEWTLQNHHGGKGDEKSIRYVSRFARNGDRILEQRGDQDGFTDWTDASQREGTTRFPQIYLTNSAGSWRYSETDFGIDHWGAHAGAAAFGGEELLDIRYLAMTGTPGSVEWGTEQLWTVPLSREPARGIKWTQVKEDDVYRVTARDSHGANCTWFIDPDRDWNATNIVARNAADVVVFEVIVELHQYDGRWMPRSTTYLQDGKPYQTYEITKAVVNEPNDPKSFTCKDIGVEPGFNISNQSNGGKRSYWSDEGPISGEEWQRRYKAGTIRHGPKMAAWMRGEYKSPYTDEARYERRKREAFAEVLNNGMAASMSEWRAYVVKFAETHGLAEGQRTTAFGILNDCNAKAEPVAAAAKKRLAESGSDAGEVLSRYSAEIQSIFVGDLKPRLELLLTEAQRAKAKANSEPAP